MSTVPPNIKKSYSKYKKDNKPNRIEGHTVSPAGKKPSKLSFVNSKNFNKGIDSKKLIEALVICKGCDLIWDGNSQCFDSNDKCGSIEDIFLVKDDTNEDNKIETEPK